MLHSHFITCKNVTISLEQASRLTLRTVTYSPVGLYLARFTVIRSSNPLPKREQKCHKQGQQQQRFSFSLQRLDLKIKFKATITLTADTSGFFSYRFLLSQPFHGPGHEKRRAKKKKLQKEFLLVTWSLFPFLEENQRRPTKASFIPVNLAN